VTRERRSDHRYRWRLCGCDQIIVLVAGLVDDHNSGCMQRYLEPRDGGAGLGDGVSWRLVVSSASAMSVRCERRMLGVA